MTATQITPVPVRIDPPPGFWRREASHAPRPGSPLSRQLERQTDWIRQMCAEQGFLLDTVDFRPIGGLIYSRVVPLVDRAGPPPPAWLSPLLSRLVPSLRRRIAAARTATRSGVPDTLIRRWHDQWRGELITRSDGLRRTDLPVLTDRELDRHMTDAIRLGLDGGEIHFRLHGAIMVVLSDLAGTCRQLLGWDTARTLGLLTGSSDSTTEPARALTGLAARARASSVVDQLITAGAPAEQVLAADDGFAAAFDDYLSRFGVRSLNYDLSEPTLGERPDVLVGLIRDQRADTCGDAAARAEAAVAEARAALAGRSPQERSRFEEALARGRLAYPVREDNEFHTVSSPYALIRLAALEIGRRLAERGQLDTREHVFWLEDDDPVTALHDGQDRRAPVVRRLGERAWVLAHPGPPTFGDDPGPPPSLDGLPPEARKVNEAFMWALEHILAPEGSTTVQSARNGTLTGTGASPGHYRGTVRVISDESEFDKLQPGDVLVCPATAPAWSVLFSGVGALVTDSGGALSHSAIIAREFGVPAVVATGNATALLRDGQLVTVDGTAGTVQVHP